ncbi:hypothetical protein Droror1_Dr00019330 [Drosera rotundifolia]
MEPILPLILPKNGWVNGFGHFSQTPLLSPFFFSPTNLLGLPSNCSTKCLNEVACFGFVVLDV